MVQKNIFYDLSGLMDEFERSFGKSWDFADGCMEPLVYVDETPDNVTVTADLPFVEKDDIIVNATENSIELEAKVRNPIQFERWGFSQKKSSFICFKKMVDIRSKIDPERAEAMFNRGILKVTIPKVKRKFGVSIK